MIRNALILVVTASELIFWQVLAVMSRCASCHKLCSVQINSCAKIYNIKKGLPMKCRLHTYWVLIRFYVYRGKSLKKFSLF